MSTTTRASYGKSWSTIRRGCTGFDVRRRNGRRPAFRLMGRARPCPCSACGRHLSGTWRCARPVQNSFQKLYGIYAHAGVGDMMTFKIEEPTASVRDAPTIATSYEDPHIATAGTQTFGRLRAMIARGYVPD